MMWIYIFHWLIIGPLLIYMALMKNALGSRFYNVIFTMGVITILYHFYKWFTRMNFNAKAQVKDKQVFNY